MLADEHVAFAPRIDRALVRTYFAAYAIGPSSEHDERVVATRLPLDGGLAWVLTTHALVVEGTRVDLRAGDLEQRIEAIVWSDGNLRDQQSHAANRLWRFLEMLRRTVSVPSGARSRAAKNSECDELQIAPTLAEVDGNTDTAALDALSAVAWRHREARADSPWSAAFAYELAARLVAWHRARNEGRPAYDGWFVSVLSEAQLARAVQMLLHTKQPLNGGSLVAALPISRPELARLAARLGHSPRPAFPDLLVIEVRIAPHAIGTWVRFEIAAQPVDAALVRPCLLERLMEIEGRVLAQSVLRGRHANDVGRIDWAHDEARAHLVLPYFDLSAMLGCARPRFFVELGSVPNGCSAQFAGASADAPSTMALEHTWRHAMTTGSALGAVRAAISFAHYGFPAHSAIALEHTGLRFRALRGALFRAAADAWRMYLVTGQALTDGAIERRALRLYEAAIAYGAERGSVEEGFAASSCELARQAPYRTRARLFARCADLFPEHVRTPAFALERARLLDS
ncbi:Hypothetical protein I5071_1040 (plasmid) [Sandaracinus amylolyticus]|nr:Hypothetical protein I5071_1040 [Sandaracinus amylolyticus]